MHLWKPSREYGLIIDTLVIDNKPAPYPVYNDRAIRASAGLMFVVAFSTFFYTFYTRNFQPLTVIVPLFWIDFFIKVVWGSEYSPFGIIGAYLVKNQKPEWVGAIQKRFAWAIGLFMATLMIVLVLIMGIRMYVPLIICGICMVFMWMETSLGICVGCKIYAKLLDWHILHEPDVRPVCPGGVCDVRKHHTKK